MKNIRPYWGRVGRPPHERAWLANAFVAKAVLGITTTVGLIERLAIDRTLRRRCGFSRYCKLPSESTFYRAFDEFAQSLLAERVHEQLIKRRYRRQLGGDGTGLTEISGISAYNPGMKNKCEGVATHWLFVDNPNVLLGIAYRRRMPYRTDFLVRTSNLS